MARVSVPLVPTTGTVWNPAGVAAEVLKVSVLFTVPFGGGMTGVGLKPQAAPAGRFAQARSTGALKPFCDATVQVLRRSRPGRH